MSIQSQTAALGGGLDLLLPAVAKNPTHLIGGRNYEPRPEGYRRMNGIERFDGRTRPSEEAYHIVDFDAGTTEPTLATTITGGTSGATGTLQAVVVESGAWGTNDAAGYIVLRSVSGTYQDDESLTFATAASANVSRGADTDALDTTYQRAAIDAARTDIQTVPGSGVVRGVWQLGNTVYAFRDNAGATACIMHQATSNGWTTVDLGSSIAYDAGTTAFAEGETLTGGTSGATATIRRVIVATGDWSTNDAAGQLTLYGVTGAFIDNETITSASGSATSNGVDAATTLATGGYFEFDNYAFTGNADSLRMYGVDGVNEFAFEFDGSYFTKILTGTTGSAPKYIAGHQGHLFVVYPDGSIQFSNIGYPLAFNAATGGAGELGLGDQCTGVAAEYKGVMIMYGQNRTAVLYGTSAADFRVDTLSRESGAYDRTVQDMATPISFDARGIRAVTATDQFGDFQAGTLSEMIRPLLDKKRKAGVTVNATCRVRTKDQYRLFFSDGTGIIASFAKPVPEFGIFSYTDYTFVRAYSCEDSGGNERIYGATSDGYVYEIDAGGSFDGNNMIAFARLAFANQGAPTQNKRYPKLTVEADIEEATTLYVSAEFSYAGSSAPAIEQTHDLTGGGGFYGDDAWEDFFWDSEFTGVAEAHIDGFGTNISAVIASEGIYEEPHTLTAITWHFSARGLKR